MADCEDILYRYEQDDDEEENADLMKVTRHFSKRLKHAKQKLQTATMAIGQLSVIPLSVPKLSNDNNRVRLVSSIKERPLPSSLPRIDSNASKVIAESFILEYSTAMQVGLFDSLLWVPSVYHCFDNKAAAAAYLKAVTVRSTSGASSALSLDSGVTNAEGTQVVSYVSWDLACKYLRHTYRSIRANYVHTLNLTMASSYLQHNPLDITGFIEHFKKLVTLAGLSHDLPYVVSLFLRSLSPSAAIYILEQMESDVR
jgi:hypothetical protein